MLKITDDYLIGFIEGEGSFYVGIVPSRETRIGWQVVYFFKVSQNPSGKVILDYLKKRLGCGYIKPNDKNDPSDKTLAFVVRDFNDLVKKVIPFLEGRLIIKRKDFEKFKKVLELVGKGEHLTKEGLTKIIDLAYSMNSGRRKIPKEKILSLIHQG
ncbi:MAG: LAGLIDADG family homing endonuclease [Microgenomates group bacterium]